MEALAGVLGLALDREAEAAQREALLRDKDLLMQEVHHRVRNSLFLVQGLLRQQIRAASLPEVRDELEQAIRRVSSIAAVHRSEEHTSELQSRQYLVCRLLLEKKKISLSRV